MTLSRRDTHKREPLKELKRENQSYLNVDPLNVYDAHW